jgi:prophage antirepressor-like protein
MIKKKIGIIIDNDDDLWFNGQDVLKTLKYKDLKKSLPRMVDASERKYLKNINHNNNISGISSISIYLSEAGLYTLIIKSQLPAAHEFKKWITHNVLPSIRKYGYYRISKDCDSKIKSLQDEINYLRDEKKKINEDCKKKKFPNGGIVYVIDYSTKYDTICSFYSRL